MRNTLHPLEYATGRNTNEISLSQGLVRIDDVYSVSTKKSPQATRRSRPVSDACLIVSTKRCRSTAVSNVGRRLWR